MDHSGMDHGGMDHGGPPAMEHYPGCTMRMLWNADTQSTCIIHPALRVHSGSTLIFYLIVLFLCGVAYERLRKAVSENDQRLRRSYLDKLGRPILPGSSPNTASAAATGEFISNDDERHPLLTLENLGAPQHIYLPRNEKLIRSGLYTLCSFISFLLMLVIMTYNVYLIAATLLGAFIGHLLFHADILGEFDDRGLACH